MNESCDGSLGNKILRVVLAMLVVGAVIAASIILIVLPTKNPQYNQTQETLRADGSYFEKGFKNDSLANFTAVGQNYGE